MKNATIKITPDYNTEDPRTAWDNAGKMVCQHSDYSLGDNDAIETLKSDIEDFKSDVEIYDYHDLGDLYDIAVEIGLFAVVLPLYLYDHSGLSISTSRQSTWDSSCIGFIYMTDADLQKEGIDKEAAERLLLSEIDIYDMYLRGDVYHFMIEDEFGDEIDSCGGFYGTDIETNGMLDYIDEDLHDLARNTEISY